MKSRRSSISAAALISTSVLAQQSQLSAAAAAAACVDDATYTSPLGLSCQHHRQVNCRAFSQIGMSTNDVDELLRRCPNSCRVEHCNGEQNESDIQQEVTSLELQIKADTLQSNSLASPEQQTSRTLQDSRRTCYDGKCFDDPLFRSKFFLPCDSHISFDCGVLQAIGFSAEEVEDLISSCPCSCLTECDSAAPTVSPSPSPTVEHSESPSGAPSSSPTVTASSNPSALPSSHPSSSPSVSPTVEPSQSPSASNASTDASVSSKPTFGPTTEPTKASVVEEDEADESIFCPPAFTGPYPSSDCRAFVICSQGYKIAETVFPCKGDSVFDVYFQRCIKQYKGYVCRATLDTPSNNPTEAQMTDAPSNSPTSKPSASPTAGPTNVPSSSPQTVSPTAASTSSSPTTSPVAEATFSADGDKDVGKKKKEKAEEAESDIEDKTKDASSVDAGEVGGKKGRGEVWEDPHEVDYNDEVDYGDQIYVSLDPPEDILHKGPADIKETQDDEMDSEDGGYIPPFQIAFAESGQGNQTRDENESFLESYGVLIIAGVLGGIIAIVSLFRFCRYRARKRMEKRILENLIFEYRYGSDARGPQPNDVAEPPANSSPKLNSYGDFRASWEKDDEEYGMHGRKQHDQRYSSERRDQR